MNENAFEKVFDALRFCQIFRGVCRCSGPLPLHCIWLYVFWELSCCLVGLTFCLRRHM